MTEDGEPVDHTVQRVPTSSLEIMLVVDTSGSMVGAPIDGRPGRGRPSSSPCCPPTSRVGVVGFGSQPSLVAGPTTDRALLASRVAELTAAGETALYDAVAFASVAVHRRRPRPGDRPAVRRGRHGEHRHPRPGGGRPACGRNVIELVTDESNRAVLGRLAAAGGGSVSSAADPAALAGLYRGAAASLANQYRVTYETSSHGAVPLTVRVATPAGALEATTDVDLPAAATPSAPTSPSSSPAADGGRRRAGAGADRPHRRRRRPSSWRCCS